MNHLVMLTATEVPQHEVIAFCAENPRLVGARSCLEMDNDIRRILAIRKVRSLLLIPDTTPVDSQ